VPSLEARRGEKEAWSLDPWLEPVATAGFCGAASFRAAPVVCPSIVRAFASIGAKRGSSIHSVFRKFTKSCFCCCVKPILKRWS
jgi:hypothetical protein